MLDELFPLLVDHWKEIATHQDIKLDPIWQHYERCNDAKILRVFTIRQDKELVGYSVYTVVPNSHYKSSLQANNDIIYLKPELRGRLTGFKFIRWCDAQLRAEGVQRVTMHIKLAHNWGKMLERQNYLAEEIIYAKRLDLEVDE